MSTSDSLSFAPDAPARGGGLTLNGKPSLSSSDAASHLDSGYSWSRPGTAATVTYAYRMTGTPPDDDSTGFQPFNAAQIAATEKALQAWEDVANIHFTRVDNHGTGYSDDATILFGDYTSGPAAGFTLYPGAARTSSASGDVWINGSLGYNAAPTVGNYGGQVLIHEIGHSIGLSHPSDYDVATNPTYAANADYAQDDTEYTVMSYFDEDETGANYRGSYSAVPLIDDITTAQRLYGANMATRTGDTVYGFNSNTGEEWFTATSAGSHLVAAVWDAGGNDTFNFSGYSQAQTIDLRQGAPSSVGGLTHNIAIAYGAVIENAIGGSGADTIIGNSSANSLSGGSGNDTLYGEGGNDTLSGGAGNDRLDGGSGNNVIDGGDGTDVLLLPGKIGDYRSAAQGSQWLITGNGLSDLVQNVENIELRVLGTTSVTSYSLGSFVSQTQAALHSYAGLTDLNGDRHSDILWRADNGDLTSWQLAGNLAGNEFQHGVLYTNVDTGWKANEVFDINGDGVSDILWRYTDGGISVWRGNGDGNFTGILADWSTGNDWRIVAAGDFNGDGKDDILWRATDGGISVWRSTGTGFQGVYYHSPIGNDWTIVGAGDFNGDGKDDVLWRGPGGAVTTWTATGDGFAEGTFYDASVGTDWHIDGIGDFDGDDQDDLFWHSDRGEVSLWKGNGGSFNNAVFYDASVGPDWHYAEIGDFNGDGRADILWRSDGGALSMWLAQGNGFNKSAYYDASVGNDWAIVSHDFPSV